ncbi:MAG: lactate utilization protein [Minisyncoccia bacterium]
MDYAALATPDIVSKTVDALTKRNFKPIVVGTKEEALAKIKELIPPGASVMNGSSRTLEEIGFVDYLKEGTHGWNNLHEAIVAEKDPGKQAELRKHSVVSDYYLGSVHALPQTGELVIASNSGSQLPHLAYTSPNIILVVGTQKITESLSDALDRIETYVIPLEDVNIMQKYGFHTMHAKTLILRQENPMLGRNVHVILVNEKLGF